MTMTVLTVMRMIKILTAMILCMVMVKNMIEVLMLTSYRYDHTGTDDIGNVDENGYEDGNDGTMDVCVKKW